MSRSANRDEAGTNDVECGRVAVDTDQPQSGQFGEKALGVPAGTDGPVDEHRARSVGVVAGQGRVQQFEAAVEQHGYMAETTGDVRHENTFST